jgi:hypothetical protein
LAKEATPVQDIPRLAFLIDGRMTMLEMCLSFLCAKRSIYITAWGLSPELLLVRGKHKCAGQPGTAEQEDLLAWLALLVKQARENFLAIKAGQPLRGHLLPYIRHDQAQEFEVEVNAVSGWLDTLSNIPEEKTDIAGTADVP